MISSGKKANSYRKCFWNVQFKVPKYPNISVIIKTAILFGITGRWVVMLYELWSFKQYRRSVLYTWIRDYS